jgi:hypothetical protein
MPGVSADDEAGEHVPIFGSWRAIYTAVIVAALAVMALVKVFSSYPF